MKFAELVEAVNAKSKVETPAVKKVLTVAFSALGEALKKQERVALPGFGTFVTKPAKEEGKPARISFRPALPKDERQKKKEARKAKLEAEPE